MDVMTHPALRIVGGPRALRRWAVAGLVANIVILVTGALVRLTASGLGCPTWPRCTEDSYVSHPALGIHGAIEFGNRLLTFALIVVAVLTFVSAMLHRPRDRRLRWLTAGLALGIPAQAVVGGITVLTKLNPFVVALHLLLSLVLIALSVWLIRLTRNLRAQPASAWGVRFARIAFVGMWVAVWLGTVTTGSGPHAGDQYAVRTGFDPALVAHLHALAVYATIAATFGMVFVVRNTASLLLLAVEVVQAGIGLSQYHLGLPIGLVLLHLLGAALALAAATNVLLSVRAADPRSQDARPDPVSQVAPRG
ncbi:MAG TPA: COX15/CtaA family protein [Microlunatus sp.]|nr:COX15/CtaA family protein [Microlunatus sp.]